MSGKSKKILIDLINILNLANLWKILIKYKKYFFNDFEKTIILSIYVLENRLKKRNILLI